MAINAPVHYQQHVIDYWFLFKVTGVNISEEEIYNYINSSINNQALPQILSQNADHCRKHAKGIH
jgi:hypothetical protein